MIQPTAFEYTIPVFLDDHDAELALRLGNTKSEIVSFLYRIPEWGYSPKDLKESLNIPRGTATSTPQVGMNMVVGIRIFLSKKIAKLRELRSD